MDAGDVDYFVQCAVLSAGFSHVYGVTVMVVSPWQRCRFSDYNIGLGFGGVVKHLGPCGPGVQFPVEKRSNTCISICQR